MRQNYTQIAPAPKLCCRFPGDGSVTKEEFETAFTAEFGATSEQASKVFSWIDKDGSGDISLDEISQLFALMDVDGENELSASKCHEHFRIKFCLRNSSTQNIKVWRDPTNNNKQNVFVNSILCLTILPCVGSGDVSKEEFVEAWTKVRGHCLCCLRHKTIFHFFMGVGDNFVNSQDK